MSAITEPIQTTAFTSVAAATSAVNAHTAVLPRLDNSLKYAFLSLVLVTVLGLFKSIPIYAHMMVSTLAIIFIGSRLSMKCSKETGGESVQTSAGIARSGPAETMKTKDAYMFPVMGSIVLFSLYLIYKFLPKEWVNVFIKAYFFLFGAIVLGQKTAYLLAALLPSNFVKNQLFKTETKVPNPLFYLEKVDKVITPLIEKIPGMQPDQNTPPPPPTEYYLPLSLLDIIALIISVLISATYISTGHWALSNLFGTAFSLQGIEMLSLGSYFNGVILLSGLFFYDIFWVFFTPVMVSVAKSFDAPIKLLFPQLWNATIQNPSMLGLGDIVIPGIFIALVLRYDVMRHLKKELAELKDASKKPEHLHCAACYTSHILSTKPAELSYFWFTLFFYYIGLTTTVVVMYTFMAAQPALLYLVPACLGASAGLAWKRKEFAALWNYSEEEETPATTEKKTE